MGGGGGGYQQYGNMGDMGDMGDISEIYSEIFSAEEEQAEDAGSQRQQRRGEDLQYELEVSFLDAMNGKEVELKVPKKKHAQPAAEAAQNPAHLQKHALNVKAEGKSA
jgi:molecular chaperone DnaJ